MSVIITPSHTCGPLFGFAILPAGIDHAVPATDPRAIVIEGEVLDHKGQHLNFDAFLEFWTQDQACRARTIAGKFRAVLARPAPLTIEGVGTQAPHIHVALFARGVTRQLVTRLYFPEDSAAHASDPVLQQIDPTRRSTLIGHSAGDGRTYRFDIRLHGEGETVFFDTTLC
ncbi:MAG: protocatechuate 3,4-dioxygenase subunit alpha [Comamonadaceae bacterium]|jgi:protocatechuate 3,4-dioxygenase alpha subunit|uniref:hypothetical protein n=1 Tax=Candidatus Skiveiella danica TaxID=3386177 RepID=UPI001B64D61C|nr:protocatechuate 3,4-dioxygenase subunit alpha [Comamonadaceae bacterium]MBK9200266.1 protocatechuate 3,4-dioxygenase subunit alpha [Betaproteobacteria bacterium]MBP6502436.1 hypothetical protein [Rhodoferax sp.]MBK6556947.1 protocatechuate 3,4-dioxygenase subunit alpha [Comamonadaceae bacterium]MBK6926492.1 protocatechuate 3,4-dioxygenase subunit alpha [Comamonadaceae bacterium]